MQFLSSIACSSETGGRGNWVKTEWAADGVDSTPIGWECVHFWFCTSIRPWELELALDVCNFWENLYIHIIHAAAKPQTIINLFYCLKYSVRVLGYCTTTCSHGYGVMEDGEIRIIRTYCALSVCKTIVVFHEIGNSEKQMISMSCKLKLKTL